MIPINLVYEDELSGFTMSHLLRFFGEKYHIGVMYDGHGFSYIKSNIRGFNQAAVATPFFVLTDLDRYECAPTLIRDWLPQPLHTNLVFRIAVKEIEAWLLADREGFAAFTGVSEANIPLYPEKEADPKKVLFEIIGRSKKRVLREDILPINQFASIGPNYNERLSEYDAGYWSIKRATKRSESLKRAFHQLKDFQYQRPKTE